jgi:hypothetical protein
MGLPKNYQEKVNLPNRIKALNDLFFYTFRYKLNLTEEAITTIYENLGKDILDTFEEFIGTITVNKTVHIDGRGGEAFGEKRFSAIDDKKAMEKYTEWLSKAKDIGIIYDYEIVDVNKKTFKEELEKKKIMDILNYKERD